MIETKAWKKLRGLADEDKCRLGGAFRETVQHLLAGCKKLAGSEYVRRHDNALKVLAVHLTLEDRIGKKIMIIDMACPNESNKEKKRGEKMRKYQQLCYEIRERRDGYKVKIIPVVIGCVGGGMKKMKDDVKELFKNEKDLQ